MQVSFTANMGNFKTFGKGGNIICLTEFALVRCVGF